MSGTPSPSTKPLTNPTSDLTDRKAQFLRWGSRDERFQMRYVDRHFLGGARLADWKIENPSDKKALAAANRFRANKQRGLYLVGPTGQGKTFLAAAIFNEMLLGWSPSSAWEAPQFRFVTESDLFMRLHASFGRPPDGSQGETEQQVLNSYIWPDVLMLDEVCRFSVQDSGYRSRVYFHLVDRRWANNKCLVLTTNRATDELTQELGEATTDRIGAICDRQLVTLKGESRR